MTREDRIIQGITNTASTVLAYGYDTPAGQRAARQCVEYGEELRERNEAEQERDQLKRELDEARQEQHELRLELHAARESISALDASHADMKRQRDRALRDLSRAQGD